MRRVLLVLVASLIFGGVFAGAGAHAQVNFDCPEFPFEPCDAAAVTNGPRAPRAPQTTARPQTADRNCSDFRTQPEAQAFFASAGAGDPHGLDSDNDGVACETLPGSLASSRSSLPRTGASTDALGIGGISFLIGGLLLLRSVRRPRDVGHHAEPPLVGW